MPRRAVEATGGATIVRRRTKLSKLGSGLEAQGMRLSQLAEALCQGENRRCHARVYSCLRHDVEQVVRSLADVGNSATGERQSSAVAAVAIDLSNLVLSHSKSVLFEQDQKLVVWMDFKELKLPKTKFLMIAAPHAANDETSDQPSAITMINRVRGLLSIRHGTLAFFREVISFDFDAEGKIHHASDWIRRPMGADLVFFPANVPASVAHQLMWHPYAVGSRHERALSFLAKAFDETNEQFRFTSYWIALEVISSGSAGAIKAKLAAAYGIRSINLVDAALRFSDISQLRHDLLHRGKFRSFRPYQERLMIAYFWDIFFSLNGHVVQRYAENLLRSRTVQEEIAGVESN